MWLDVYNDLTAYIAFVMGIRLGDFKLRMAALKTLSHRFSSFGSKNYEPLYIKYLLTLKNSPRSVLYTLEKGTSTVSVTGNGHSKEARDEVHESQASLGYSKEITVLTPKQLKTLWVKLNYSMSKPLCRTKSKPTRQEKDTFRRSRQRLFDELLALNFFETRKAKIEREVSTEMKDDDTTVMKDDDGQAEAEEKGPVYGSEVGQLRPPERAITQPIVNSDSDIDTFEISDPTVQEVHDAGAADDVHESQDEQLGDGVDATVESNSTSDDSHEEKQGDAAEAVEPNSTGDDITPPRTPLQNRWTGQEATSAVRKDLSNIRQIGRDHQAIYFDTWRGVGFKMLRRKGLMTKKGKVLRRAVQLWKSTRPSANGHAKNAKLHDLTKRLKVYQEAMVRGTAKVGMSTCLYPPNMFKGDGTKNDGDKSKWLQYMQDLFEQEGFREEFAFRGRSTDRVDVECIDVPPVMRATVNGTVLDRLKILIERQVLVSVKRGVKRVVLVWDKEHVPGKANIKSPERAKRDKTVAKAPLRVALNTLWDINLWEDRTARKKVLRLWLGYLKTKLGNDFLSSLHLPSDVRVVLDFGLADSPVEITTVSTRNNPNAILVRAVDGLLSNAYEADTIVHTHLWKMMTDHHATNPTVAMKARIVTIDSDFMSIVLLLGVNQPSGNTSVNFDGVTLQLLNNYVKVGVFRRGVEHLARKWGLSYKATALTLAAVFILSGSDYTSFFVKLPKNRWLDTLRGHNRGFIMGPTGLVDNDGNIDTNAFIRMTVCLYMDLHPGAFRDKDQDGRVLRPEEIDERTEDEKRQGALPLEDWFLHAKSKMVTTKEELRLSSLFSLLEHCKRSNYVLQIWRNTDSFTWQVPGADGQGWIWCKKSSSLKYIYDTKKAMDEIHSLLGDFKCSCGSGAEKKVCLKCKCQALGVACSRLCHGKNAAEVTCMNPYNNP